MVFLYKTGFECGNTVGSRKEIKLEFEIVIINRVQEAAIIGMILGDAYLQKTGAKNARLRLEHGLRQKEYLIWKAQLLPQLFQGKPTLLNRVHPLTGSTYSYARWQSNASPALGKLRALFYTNGKKLIPKNLAKLLKSEISFAIWFYDDGYYYVRDRSLYLYLGTVSEHEAEIAREALRTNFHLESKVLNKKNKGFCLYFPVSEREKIKNILAKFLVPGMLYKIPS